MLKMTFRDFLIASLCILGLPFLSHAAAVNSLSKADPNGSIDLSAAVLVLAPGMTGPEKKASEMLLDEIEKRSWIRWTITNRLPKNGEKGVVLGQIKEIIRSYPALSTKLKAGDNHKAEGYQIITLESGLVIVAGNELQTVAAK